MMYSLWKNICTGNRENYIIYNIQNYQNEMSDII